MEKVDKRAVFLDRDGVLNHLIDRGDSCFVSGRKVRFTAPWKYEEFRLFDRVSKSLQKLREAGFDGKVWQAGLGNPTGPSNYMLKENNENPWSA